MAASAGIDGPHALMYDDMVRQSLSDAARKALFEMDPATYEFQSDFAKRHRAEGMAQLLLNQLQLKFTTVPPETEARVRQASTVELEHWSGKALSAQALAEVFSEDGTRG